MRIGNGKLKIAQIIPILIGDFPDIRYSYAPIGSPIWFIARAAPTSRRRGSFVGFDPRSYFSRSADVHSSRKASDRRKLPGGDDGEGCPGSARQRSERPAAGICAVLRASEPRHVLHAFTSIRARRTDAQRTQAAYHGSRLLEGLQR